MKKRLIVFDFDGVILDTFDFAFSLTKRLTKKHNTFPVVSREDFEEMFEDNPWTYFERKKIKGDVFLSYQQDFRLAFQKDEHSLQLFSEIRDILEKLAHDFHLAIVSSNYRDIVIRHIEKNSMRLYFSEIVGAEEKGSKSDKLKRIIADLRVSNKDCFFVTDTSGDIREGQKVGMKTIAVSWGYHDKLRLEKVKPNFIAHTPKQLLKVFYS